MLSTNLYLQTFQLITFHKNVNKHRACFLLRINKKYSNNSSICTTVKAYPTATTRVRYEAFQQSFAAINDGTHRLDVGTAIQLRCCHSTSGRMSLRACIEVGLLYSSTATFHSVKENKKTWFTLTKLNKILKYCIK